MDDVKDLCLCFCVENILKFFQKEIETLYVIKVVRCLIRLRAQYILFIIDKHEGFYPVKFIIFIDYKLIKSGIRSVTIHTKDLHTQWTCRWYSRSVNYRGICLLLWLRIVHWTSLHVWKIHLFYFRSGVLRRSPFR